MALNFIEIGKQISNARHRAGLSQAQLCDLIDRDQSYISKVESGIKSPSLELVVDIANVLEISVDALLGSNLKNTLKKNDKDQLDDLLKGCSIKERHMLFQILKSVKTSIREFIQ